MSDKLKFCMTFLFSTPVCTLYLFLLDSNKSIYIGTATMFMYAFLIVLYFYINIILEKDVSDKTCLRDIQVVNLTSLTAILYHGVVSSIVLSLSMYSKAGWVTTLVFVYLITNFLFSLFLLKVYKNACNKKYDEEVYFA